MQLIRRPKYTLKIFFEIWLLLLAFKKLLNSFNEPGLLVKLPGESDFPENIKED